MLLKKQLLFTYIMLKLILKSALLFIFIGCATFNKSKFDDYVFQTKKEKNTYIK